MLRFHGNRKEAIRNQGKITGIIANYFNVDKNFIKITIN